MVCIAKIRSNIKGPAQKDATAKMNWERKISGGEQLIVTGIFCTQTRGFFKRGFINNKVSARNDQIFEELKEAISGVFRQLNM